MEPLMALKHVSYSIVNDGKMEKLLSDISLHINPGEFFALLGSSSAAKTLLLSLICGVIPPSQGDIQSTCRHIGYMHNHDKLLEWRSLFYNAALGKNDHLSDSTSEYSQEDYISHMMKACHLEEMETLHPTQVSALTKKKISLIRALASEPELLIMNDVFSSLDYDSRTSLRQEIHSLLKEEGKAAILSTHDITEAILFADRAAVLSPDGHIVRILSLSFPDIANDLEAPRLKNNRFHVYFNELWRSLN